MNKMLYNDQIIDRKTLIDIEDRGYQFGDGIYEVIGVYQGKLFMLDEHMERLERSAEKIQLNLPYSIQKLKQKIIELVQINKLYEGVVYLQISRGIAERWHYFPSSDTPPVTVAYTKLEESMTEEENNGAKAVLTQDIRWLRCDIKTLNLLPNVLAKQKAMEAGAVEAILHRGDIVTEASSSNVFIVKDGTVLTHPATNYILNGITRKKVLAICEELNVNAEEKTFTVHELLEADEVFITATKLDIVPVTTVDDQQIGNGSPGVVTRKVLHAFRSSLDELIN